jgi:hypothetical protein
MNFPSMNAKWRPTPGSACRTNDGSIKTLQAQRQQQEQRSLQENKHFNPQAYNAPAPWNMYDQKTGRTSDYRRGVSG